VQIRVNLRLKNAKEKPCLATGLFKLQLNQPFDGSTLLPAGFAQGRQRKGIESK
jgi:hypothetical protein